MEKEFKPLNNVIEADECMVAGIGAVKLKGYSVTVSVSLEYLKRAIKVIEALHKGESDVRVDIAITNDYPLVVGRYDKETGVMSGVIIAPRVNP